MLFISWQYSGKNQSKKWTECLNISLFIRSYSFFHMRDIANLSYLSANRTCRCQKLSRLQREYFFILSYQDYQKYMQQVPIMLCLYIIIAFCVEDSLVKSSFFFLSLYRQCLITQSEIQYNNVVLVQKKSFFFNYNIFNQLLLHHNGVVIYPIFLRAYNTSSRHIIDSLKMQTFLLVS